MAAQSMTEESTCNQLVLFPWVVSSAPKSLSQTRVKTVIVLDGVTDPSLWHNIHHALHVHMHIQIVRHRRSLAGFGLWYQFCCSSNVSPRRNRIHWISFASFVGLQAINTVKTLGPCPPLSSRVQHHLRFPPSAPQAAMRILLAGDTATVCPMFTATKPKPAQIQEEVTQHPARCVHKSTARSVWPSCPASLPVSASLAHGTVSEDLKHRWLITAFDDCWINSKASASIHPKSWRTTGTCREFIETGDSTISQKQCICSPWNVLRVCSSNTEGPPTLYRHIVNKFKQELLINHLGISERIAARFQQKPKSHRN